MDGQRRRMLYVGTYTPDSEPAGAGRGVYRVWFDPVTGEFADAEVAARVSGPSFLALDPDHPWIHAVSERTDGAVTTLRVEDDGGLTELGRSSSHGASPCHVLALGGSRVAVANYADGRVCIVASGPDGASKPEQLFTHTGHGPVADRQQGPHAHSGLAVHDDTAGPGPVTLLVADLGTDELRAYRVGERSAAGPPGEASGPGAATGPAIGSDSVPGADADAAAGAADPTTAPAPDPVVASGPGPARGEPWGTIPLPPGTGPRHMALSADGRHLYVTGELDSRVHVLHWRGGPERTEHLGSVPATAHEPEGGNLPSEIAAHRDRLYVANRGADVVATFAPRDGGAGLEHLADTPVGPWPRHFTVVRGHGQEPDHLVVAAQNGDSLMSLRLDPGTGLPVDTGHRLSLPVPVCVLPVPLRRIRRGERPGGSRG